MHPTKSPQKIAVLNEHQISFENDDTGLSISVCNMGTMDRYALRNVKLSNINGKGFEAALFGTNKDFTVKVEEGVRDVEGVQEKVLEIKICYQPAFLVKVEEKLVLPWKNKLNELHFYQSKAQRIQRNLREIAQKNNSRSKIARVVESKQFKSNINNNGQYYDQGNGDANYDILPFESINLPQPSRYNIEISFYLNCTATYFYFYHDNVTYSSIFPAGAMMVPVNNQYIPVKLSYIFDNKTANVKTHTFYAYDIVDYPFRVRNLVITATKMMD